MKKKNFIIVFLIVVIVYGGFVLIYSKNAQNNNQENPSNNESHIIDNGDSNVKDENKYLLIENTDIWLLRKERWNEKKKFETDEKLSIFINARYFGDYYVKFINHWNLTDDNNKYVDYNGNSLAFSKDFNIKVIEYNDESISEVELNEINSIINTNVLEEYLSINEKVIIDLDKNGINDKIVNVSNLDSENQSIYFNLVYVILNGKTNILVKDFVDIRDVLTEPVYNIQYILNIENEISDSIILRKGYFSNNGETTSILYQYNNQYEKVIGE